MRFDGKTYESDKDKDRLSTQLLRVRKLMSDGEWRTLAQVAAAVESSEAGASARLRDLRKKRFGKRLVDRERLFGGLFVYRLRVRGKARVSPGKFKRKWSRCACGVGLRWYERISPRRAPRARLCKSCSQIIRDSKGGRSLK
jgi:hypothetical protein